VILVLVGPTAVGKSRLAVAIARRLATAGRPAEVVNADSMQVYRGMDIGTAKPTAAEQQGVRHHLLDILDVRDTATVADFQQRARAAIAECRARGAQPIVVGGSALYIRAIVDDFRFPGTDPALRARLETELSALGPKRLHQRLARLDPAAAGAILPVNGRRIVRALEVIELTSQPFTASLPARRYALPDVIQVGLGIDRPALDDRIADRVNQMWRAGLVTEVRRLTAAGLPDGLTASRALGYRQVLSFLAGEISEEQARELTIGATRRFARRQDAWFRKDPRIVWLPHQTPDLADRVLDLLGSPVQAAAMEMPD
jgi:tRNA dimethylallyltransferase